MQKLIEKNLKLECVFNSFSEGVAIIDRELNVLFENESSKLILGVSIAEVPPQEWVTGIGILKVNEVQPIDHNELPLSLALRGIPVTDHLLFIKNQFRPEGIFLSADACSLKDDSGIVQAAILTFRDVTSRLLRERKIIEQRYFFQRLIDFIPAYIGIRDLSGNITFANKKFEETYAAKGGLIGKSIKDIFPDVVDKFDQETLEIIKSKKEQENHVAMMHPDGTLHHFHTIRFPVFDEKQNIEGVCTIAFDETQELEQQRMIELERIKNINASKLAELGTLAAEIGHEINNPLGIIKTSVVILNSMLDDSEPVEHLRDQLEVIDNTTTRITDIVTALRHLSRNSSNEALALWPIREILTDVRVLTNTKFKIKNIHLMIDDIDVSLDLMIPCYRIQLSQVLLNVLGNACDATEKVKNAWVKIKLAQDDDYFYFKITDSGPGVSPEFSDRIFDAFFTTKQLGEGTGLGLGISKEIMKKHGGDIILDQTSGPNCFVISLPKK